MLKLITRISLFMTAFIGVAWFWGFIGFADRVFGYLEPENKEHTYVNKLFENRSKSEGFVDYKDYERQSDAEQPYIAGTGQFQINSEAKDLGGNGEFIPQKQEMNKTQKETGIAVLTGGRNRIAKGLELLDEGKGGRMLISGVSDGVTLQDIAELEGVQLYDDMPIDLGYKARTTVGNAKEIKEWVMKNGYHRLVAVTSFYHIPRSLLELEHAMPDIGIRFHAVSSGYVQKQWWKHWGSFCFLASEYCKYLAVQLKFLI